MNSSAFSEIDRFNSLVKSVREALAEQHSLSQVPDKGTILSEGEQQISKARDLHQSADNSFQLSDAYAALLIAAGECARQLREY